ncbi:helix-turn-helix domain-containing protein (plasmid) [Methanocaldococcus sp. 16A]
MIEIKFSKIPKWEEINKIIKQSKHSLILLKFPKSVYEHPKMQYKLEVLKQEPNIFIDVENSKRGKKRVVDDNTREKIITLLKDGYPIRRIGEELGLAKSTVWDYAKEYIKELKEEHLKNLIWKYKEKLIEEDLWDSIVEMLFLELEMHIKNKDIEQAKKKLDEIINYVNSEEDYIVS